MKIVLNFNNLNRVSKKNIFEILKYKIIIIYIYILYDVIQ